MLSSMKMDEYMESELLRKYSAWVPEDPNPSCLSSVISFSEKTYKCFEPGC